jgi:hypothetical protein
MPTDPLVAAVVGMIHSVLGIRHSIEKKWNLLILKQIKAKLILPMGPDRRRPSCLIRTATNMEVAVPEDGLIVQRCGCCAERNTIMAFSRKSRGLVWPHSAECYSSGFPVFPEICARIGPPDLICKPVPHNRLID